MRRYALAFCECPPQSLDLTTLTLKLHLWWTKSGEAEERKDHGDDHNQADNIDYAVHLGLLQKVLSARGNAAAHQPVPALQRPTRFLLNLNLFSHGAGLGPRGRSQVADAIEFSLCKTEILTPRSADFG